MNVLIFGTGFVGTTMGLVFAEMGHRVTCIDNDQTKIDALQRGEPYFYEPGIGALLTKHLDLGNIQFSTEEKRGIERNHILFICVGTPSNIDGSADLSFIQQVCQSIGRCMNGYKVIVNKSTAPVGTCAHIYTWIAGAQSKPCAFDVVSNPEFLREGHALSDGLNPERIVIGSESPKAIAALKDLYARMKCPIVLTKPRTAELVKYAANSFLATKISFVNEIARLCDVLDVNVKDVSYGMGLDPRIGPQFLEAGIGYGGSCFPKDTHALIAASQEKGISLSILQKVLEVNQTQVLYFLDRIRRELDTFEFKKIAIFGLSFKPHTSDTREAPALSVIRELLKEKAIVCVHDPAAKLPLKLTDRVLQCDTPEMAAEDTDAVLICTEWPEYKTLDWRAIRCKMRGAYLFDGRNMLDPAQMVKLGFTYAGIGYP